jgi:hypothetical protein
MLIEMKKMVKVSTNKASRCLISEESKQRILLSQKISDLELKIPGTRLEALINELYRELEEAGTKIKPKTYLSDEWGCPQGIPVIGIPFYLADPELCKLEEKLTGIEAETDAEVLVYLRHEAGHAFNYAYQLYEEIDWQLVFGKYYQPYVENYSSSPFSARFVRHVPGWYAQKHPDEDFAETFAVWLTPDSNWKKVYARTPAFKKLLYVDRIVRQHGKKPPPVTPTKLDKPVQELNMTLDTWYETCKGDNKIRPKLNPVIDEDLRRLFPDKRGRDAAGVLQENRRLLIRDVNCWTGLDRHLLTSLFDELLDKVSSLGRKIETQQTKIRLISASAFLATLATNYQITGQFMQE